MGPCWWYIDRKYNNDINDIKYITFEKQTSVRIYITIYRKFGWFMALSGAMTGNTILITVTNYGERGLQNGRRGGGHVKFCPYKKGGHKQFWGSFYTVAFSHIEGRA